MMVEQLDRGAVTGSIADRLVTELATVQDSAEIINGRIVPMSPTGGRPSRAGGAIFISLRQWEKHASGWAYPDNAAYIVDLPNRTSFSPDASFHRGSTPDMKFLQGAPAFAAEVRSEGDYGVAAEQAIAAKRADYFAAGTQVVWDVDLLHEDVVRVYRAQAPTEATLYRKGQRAEAEPAVPGWTFAVDELFE